MELEEDERAAELELMRAMYSEDDGELVISESAAATVLAVRLLPRSGGEKAQRYMEATLRISLLPEYPCQPPAVSLGRSRGLVDEEEARLLSEVRAHAS